MEFSSDYFSSLLEQGLRDIKYPTLGPRLFDPVRYTLEGGGKRLRPSLLMASYASISGKDPQNVLSQALAVEMFHNFTLVHDDVMDNAELRRGRPTVFTRWNTPAAVLSGDAMLTMASVLLNTGYDTLAPVLNSVFNNMALEVYQGQQLDMEFEKRDNVSVDEYIEMIRLKTSVLLAASCELGTILAGASDDVRRAFSSYGEALGLAFQLRDDWLDTYGDAAVFGKEIGGDIINRKKTWLLITALDEAPELADVLAEDLADSELVQQVRRQYDALDLGERCRELAQQYSDKAIRALRGVEIDSRATDYFVMLARNASTRDH